MTILKRINWYKAAGALAILISSALVVHLGYWAWQIVRVVG